MTNRQVTKGICLIRTVKVVTAALLWASAQFVLAVESPVDAPATIYWEQPHLVATKANLRAASEEVQQALTRLRCSADQALQRGPYSVVQKQDTPPSGDKHDYLSFSRYWWPNPNTDDGLPYVRRDGETNVKMRARGDRDSVGMLIEDVEALALAYYYFDDDSYAEHAGKLIRAWFLDPATRMNPNLKYGQAVLGRSEGRGVGIIDTRGFILILDATALLEKSPHFSSDDVNELRRWFTNFLEWLRTSNLGIEEGMAENNHGSWYAAQAARIAVFTGQTEVARQTVEDVRTQRIPAQFQANGSQPAELKRTRSLHYSLFNLSALSAVARVGEHLGIDLWNYRPQQGGGMRAGLDFVVPYTIVQRHWPYPQMGDYELSPRVVQLLRMASKRYRQQAFLDVIDEVGRRHGDRDFSALQFNALSNPFETSKALKVSVAADFQPADLDYQLPDISGYTVAGIRESVPTERDGIATIGPTAGEPVLEETFRKDRREDFRQRQGNAETRAIKVRSGTLALADLVRQVDNREIAEIDAAGKVTLRLPVLIQPGATLLIDGTESPVLRLSTDRGVFLANAGTLFVLDAEVSSWDESNQTTTAFVEKSEFRPFMASYIRSQTFLANSVFSDLGYHAPTSYGISLSSSPERHRGESDDWPTGIFLGNQFQGIYYGFYSFEARDVVLLDNVYNDNVVYGIDPHDRSTRLVIARNTTSNTRQKHGIIGSRGIADSFIFDNVSHGNHGSAIMLDRQCVDNVIHGNTCYDNGQGIAIYESPRNLIVDNLVARNRKSGIRVRNSVDVQARNNSLVANGDYGFEVYAKQLDDHQNRVARGDLYATGVGVALHDNLATGNTGGLIKGSNIGYLHMSNFRFTLVRERVSLVKLVSDLKLDRSSDHQFGSELKPYADELSHVFGAARLLIKVTGN